MVYEAIKEKSGTARQLARRLGLSPGRGPVILAPFLSALTDHTRKNAEGQTIGRKVSSEFVNCDGSHPFAIQESKYYVTPKD